MQQQLDTEIDLCIKNFRNRIEDYVINPVHNNPEYVYYAARELFNIFYDVGMSIKGYDAEQRSMIDISFKQAIRHVLHPDMREAIRIMHGGLKKFLV
ncbi:MAG: hypothetical protein Q7S74_03515 [Nanoarchaeota archaeon]|nr:hypothetical protein [Nanoarchaeota archaeon]